MSYFFLFQKSRKQPSILNYFSEITSIDDELANDVLAGIDVEEFETFEKRSKLHYSWKGMTVKIWLLFNQNST